MAAAGVPWRRVAAIAAVAAVFAVGVLVITRAGSLPVLDANATRSARWFVHQPTGRVVLVDGFSGRALARVESDDSGRLEVVDGPVGGYVLDTSAGTARPIDTAALRLGAVSTVDLLARPDVEFGVGRAGLMVVDPDEDEASVLSVDGGDARFDAESGPEPLIAPDGTFWSIVGGALTQRSATGDQVAAVDVGVDAVASLVGSRAVALDGDRSRVRLSDGDWVELSADVPGSELVLQEPGPASSCAWVAGNDQLWCVGSDRIERQLVVDGLDAAGSDWLAVSGDAGVLVRRGTGEIVRFSPRTGALIDQPRARVPAAADLRISVTVDLIWIDDARGDTVWTVHPWGLHAVAKDDAGTPLIDEDGEVIEEGGGDAVLETGRRLSGGDQRPAVDDDGIDDPPVAVDDRLGSRAGSPVTINVTANDFDPDGQAVAVVEVGAPSNGTAEIASASQVVYRPNARFVGLDSFTYEITDGINRDEAVVFVEVLPLDGANRPPMGRTDRVTTRPGTRVVVDVLANDVDPERDPIRIGSFVETDGGSVTEAPGPSGLPALQFVPDEGRTGLVAFSYRPEDSLGALGEEVRVFVEIADFGDANRPPLTQPDAALVVRGVAHEIPVLANDRDPDNDLLSVSLETSRVPAGLDVDIGADNVLVVTARPGAGDTEQFSYFVTDGNSDPVEGQVLVVVSADDGPNRPPLASPDVANVVVGTTQEIDVTANDFDPDGDPLVVVDVTSPSDGGKAVGTAGGLLFTPATDVVDDEPITSRFTYTITDGNGHFADGEVVVRVLPAPLPQPPFAADDAARTPVNESVVIDVLANDSDPSGERPTLFGQPSCAGGGFITTTSDGQVRFTPPRSQVGDFRCTYEIINSSQIRASATIVITVFASSTRREPIARADTYSVDVGTTRDLDVLANDVDPDGTLLRITDVSAPRVGAASIALGGRAVRFEAPDAPDTVTLRYWVTDQDGDISNAAVTINVVPAVGVQGPVAVDDRRTVPVGSPPVRVEVLANDRDPDGDESALRLLSVRQLLGDGTARVDGSVVVMAPAADFVGRLTAEYTIEDDDGLTASGSILLDVVADENRPPTAVDDSAEVTEGGSVTVNVLSNDSDLDGDPLELDLLTTSVAGLGTASQVGESSIRFEALPGADGVAFVRYQVSDGIETDVATLAIRVLGCANNPPVANDAFYSTGYQQPIDINLFQHVGSGEIVSVEPPLGQAVGTVTPPPGENGNIVFDYVVENACGDTDVGTVTIDVNQDPTASPLSVQLQAGQVSDVPVTAFAADDEVLRIDSLGGAPSWASIVDGSKIRLAPPPSTSGVHTFAARVVDPGGLHATAEITVTIANRPPVAVDDDVVVTGEVVTLSPLNNDSDPDGDPVVLQQVPTQVTFANGVTRPIEQVGSSQLRIDLGTAAGPGTFVYTIRDTRGAVSGQASFTLRVNREPIANQLEVTIVADTPTDVPVPVSDPDGDPLTVDVTDPNGASITVVNGTVMRITAGFRNFTVDPTGTYSYWGTYIVRDPSGADDWAWFFLRVLPPPTTTPPPTTPPPTTTTTTPPPTTTTTPPATTTTTTTPPATTTTTTPPATTTTTSPPAPTTTTTAPPSG